MEDDPDIYHWHGPSSDDDVEGSGFLDIVEEYQRSRCWNFKSTSQAFCEAMDKRPKPVPRKAGFLR